ncbi:MAG: CorA family divalent cation transporter [Myxococcota bacterium]
MEAQIGDLDEKAGLLEQRATQGTPRSTEPLVEELYQVRHELLVLKTIAAQDREICARLAALAPRFPAATWQPYVQDTRDQMERLSALCEAEREFVQGVLDFHQTRATSRINLAMERLALLAAVVLPVTAVASVYGMNVIVNDQTNLAQLAQALATMGLLMSGMLWWSRRQGWW